jgi:hypothetical protein
VKATEPGLAELMSGPVRVVGSFATYVVSEAVVARCVASPAYDTW